MTAITPFDTDPLKALAPVETGDWESGQILMKNFRVERVLGEGGMGKVYLVFSEAGDEFLAVKTLRRSVLNRSKSKRHFIRELRTWIDLPLHPNITACRFFRTIQDRMAVFSEYVDGGALNDWIEQEKGLSLLKALDIAIQIARGIDAAHRQHVIHQDIKPSNILLTRDGVAKITDFGLARARHSTGLPDDFETGSSAHTLLVSSGGMTPAFCSPEQAEKGRISRKTDIWSYGLTVLQLFTGRVMWRLGCLAPEILDQYLATKPVYPYPDMPGEVADILRKCFQPDPRNRWRSCDLIARELQAVYERISGCPYFRPEPEPLRPVHERSTRSPETPGPWPDPSKWIDRLAEAAGSKWIMPGQWMPERHGTFKTRALSDLEIYEDIVSLYVQWIQKGHLDRTVDLAELLRDKAGVHEFVDDITGAIDQYRKSTSLQLQDRKRARSRVGRAFLAGTFRELALAYHVRRSPVESIKCCHTALKVLDATPATPEPPAPVPERARIYVVLGNALYMQEAFQDAVDAFDTAEKIMNSWCSTGSEEERIVCTALLYRSRSNSMKMLHRDEEALENLRKAMAVYDAVDPCVMSAKILRDKAATHMNLANLLSRMERQDECLENHDKSIEIKEKLINELGWELIAADLSLDYMNKAVSLQNLRRANEALELLDKALEMKREIV
nr:serine/threonine-protein kinase [bacterium]